MVIKVLLTFISIVALAGLLFFYLAPFQIVYFGTNSGNHNFSILGNNTEMQFYPNIRFPFNEISYKIFNCTLQKKDDMQYAFTIIENLTSLRFSPVSDSEEISVTCEEKNRYDNGLFIAGEGGPVNITATRNFNVVTKGEISLIKNSDCVYPNIAIHELLHVLGFKHSDNPNNIMYNITNCNQVISDDVIRLINQLYAVPSYPDLVLENVSGIMKGRFLEVNFSVINAGLSDAKESNVTIYSGDKLIQETTVHSLLVGYGRFVHISNIWIPQTNIEKLSFDIKYNFEEIDKENNKATLEIR